jgi:hypothetical protein
VGADGLLRKHAGFAGSIRSLSRSFSSIGRAEAEIAITAAIPSLADEEKNDHFQAFVLFYPQFPGAA